MKQLNFKKTLNGLGNTLDLIPESYKTNENTFIMTDGNEKYKIRWEGTVNEGKAVVLTASDKQMVNEDMAKMRHLMGYKSSDNPLSLSGAERVNEEAAFTSMVNKTKNLLSEAEKK